MSNVELVLLKRDWRTNMGRFRRNGEGIPTEIPKKVLRRYPLPKDAVVVGPDYVLPQHRDEENEDVAMTAAKQEAEINRRVNEELDRRERERLAAAGGNGGGDDDDDEDGEAFDDSILDKSITEITEALVGKGEKELRWLLEKEQGGKTRKGVVVALEAALEDLEAD